MPFQIPVLRSEDAPTPSVRGANKELGTAAPSASRLSSVAAYIPSAKSTFRLRVRVDRGSSWAYSEGWRVRPKLSSLQ